MSQIHTATPESKEATELSRLSAETIEGHIRYGRELQSQMIRQWLTSGFAALRRIVFPETASVQPFAQGKPHGG